MMSYKSFMATGVILISALWAAHVQAQGEPSGKTLAATIDVYVFPTQGQDASQQSMDEAACYNWAVENTGTDPFELAKKAEAQLQQADSARQQAAHAGDGAGAAGAVGGAAAGALVGAIAGDTGKGAAIGATTGLLVGRARRREAKQQATAQVEQQAAYNQQATAEQIENFKKAFSVCLEANDYMVKF